MAKDAFYTGTGRRKEATATVRLTKGKGNVTVNGMALDAYFPLEKNQQRVLASFTALEQTTDYDAELRVRGGGKHGQADACSLAIARALRTLSDDLRPTLKKAGLLRRDTRIKERKKYGLKRARKAPQFTKR